MTIDFEESVTEEESDRPLMSSPDWPSYVMSQFTESELVKKDKQTFPKVDGLRRVVEVLLGPIIEGVVDTVDPASKENDYTATVEYSVTISCNNIPGASSHTRVFKSVADAGLNNADPKFRRFPSALAETRAEGRALRKALRLNVACAEELSDVAMEDDIDSTPATANDLMLLQKECKKRKIDYEQFCTENNIGPKVSKTKVKLLMSSLYEEK